MGQKIKSKSRAARQTKRKKNLTSNIAWAVSNGTITDQAFTSGQPVNPSLSYYRVHSTVRAAISAKAINISQIPLVIEEGPPLEARRLDDTSKGARRELFNVIDHPNHFMITAQMIEGTVINLDQDGMAFWVLARKKFSEIPSSISIWRSRHFEPLLAESPTSKGPALVGWFFTPGSGMETTFLSNDEVVVFRYFDPDFPWMGLSPLRAAIRGINFDSLAAVYSESFFRNSGDPGGVIESPRPLKDKQISRIVSQWEARHQGPYSAHRVAVLAGAATYRQINISNKDIEFIDQRKWSRDEILAVLKVPKSEISVYEDLSHANAVSQNRSFWEKTLIPIINIINGTIRHQFTLGIAAELSIRQLRIYLDIKSVPALQPQLTDIVTNAEKLFKMGYPINAINEKLALGLPSVEWGDEGYANSALATFDDIRSGEARKGSKPSNPSPPEPAGEEGEEGEEGEDGKDLSISPFERDVREKLKELKEMFGLTAKPGESQIITPLYFEDRDKLKAFFRRMRASHLKRVEDDSISIGINKDLWTEKLRKRFPHFNDKILSIFVALICTKLENIVSDDDKDKVKKNTTKLFNALSKKSSLKLLVTALGRRTNGSSY